MHSSKECHVVDRTVDLYTNQKTVVNKNTPTPQKSGFNSNSQVCLNSLFWNSLV